MLRIPLASFALAIGVSGSGPFLRIVFNVALQNRVSCRQQRERTLSLHVEHSREG